MIIREARISDKSQIDKIYKEYFGHNEYPNLFEQNEFRCPFVITDSDEKIILAGGIKTIAEAVLITDQSRSVRVRQEALIQALGSTVFIAQGMKYGQVYAFVNDDESYAKHLQKYGFRLIDAKLLVLDFGESNG